MTTAYGMHERGLRPWGWGNQLVVNSGALVRGNGGLNHTVKEDNRIFTMCICHLFQDSKQVRKICF